MSAVELGDVVAWTEADYRDWLREQEAKLRRATFHRVEARRSSRARSLDCGHAIDATEPYRYQVWKEHQAPGVCQRLECEFCARRDARY